MTPSSEKTAPKLTRFFLVGIFLDGVKGQISICRYKKGCTFVVTCQRKNLIISDESLLMGHHFEM